MEQNNENMQWMSFAYSMFLLFLPHFSFTLSPWHSKNDETIKNHCGWKKTEWKNLIFKHERQYEKDSNDKSNRTKNILFN